MLNFLGSVIAALIAFPAFPQCVRVPGMLPQAVQMLLPQRRQAGFKIPLHFVKMFKAEGQTAESRVVPGQTADGRRQTALPCSRILRAGQRSQKDFFQLHGAENAAIHAVGSANQ